MKKTMSLLVMLFGVLACLQAQVVFTENFEGGTLANWTSSQLSGTAGIWTATSTLANPTTTANGGTFVGKFNCYDASAGSSTRLTLTTPINFTTSPSAPILKFFMFHDSQYPASKDSIKVRWSIDGGATWSNGMVGFGRVATANIWQEHVVSLTGAETQANVKVCFDGISAYGNNVFIDDITLSIPENMNWTSCTAVQSNTSLITPTAVKAQILDLQLVTAGTLNPVTVSSFEFNTTGTTAAVSDIAKIQLWSNSTLTNSNFSTAATQVGADVTTGLDGAVIVTPTTPLTLASGTNYFWLTYDVAATATAGNVLDAQFVKVVASAKVDHLPTVGNPAGSRMIKNMLSGTYTIDPLGSGAANYTTFTQAVTELNALGISAPVVFNVAAGAVFDEVIPAITATGTAVNTITFQKSGTGINPKIQGTGVGALDCGILIISGDYFTFDGIDVEDKVANTTATTQIEFGYYLFGGYAANGAQYITIKNCNITLNKANASTKAIYCATGIAATAAEGANSYNKFDNIKMDNSYWGIIVSAVASTFFNEGNEISNCEIGGVVGIGGGTAFVCGIYTNNEKNLKIYNTTIKNVTASNANVYGIYALPMQGTANIYNNKVYNVTMTGTAVASKVYGIRAESAATQTTNLYNNMVFGLNHGVTTASATIAVRGFGINLGTGMTGTVNLLHNTVNMETVAAATNRIVDASLGTVNIKNNVFINSTPAQTTAKHYIIGVAAAVVMTSDYNDLYVANAGNGFVGVIGSTDKATFADWQAAVAGLDANSKNFNPTFVSATDLHLQVIDENNPIRDAAPRLTDVLKDIDGEDRTEMTDMGCDEAISSSINANIPSTTLLAQNYPNPFNPETTINFALAKESKVSLTIYNAKGEFVQELVNTMRTAGNHSVKFNALGFNSGVYFYKLSTPETTVTKKMLLVK